MTAQIPDEIEIEGTVHPLAATPLDSWLEPRGLSSDFVAPHTACWRGYIATWAVRDDALWLDAVHAWIPGRGPLAGLTGLVRPPDGDRRTAPTRLREWEGLVLAQARSGLRPRGRSPNAWLVGADLTIAGNDLEDFATTATEDAGFFVHDGASGELWAPVSEMRLVAGDLIAEPSALDLDVVIPDDAPLVSQAWIRVHEVSMSYSGTTMAPVPEGVTAWRLIVDAEPRWWRVEDLLISSREPVETDFDHLGSAPLPVMADWYTGSLRVPQGEQVAYVHAGFESVYEADLFLSIDEGRITGRTLIENR